MTAAIQQQIIKKIGQLNSFQISELLDFLRFLTSQKNNASSPGTIESIHGKYVERLSDTEEFLRRKKSEIRKEQDKWQAK